MYHSARGLPVATAFFVSTCNAGKSDYIFTDCNEAFRTLFGLDVKGRLLSDISGEISGLFKEIAKHADDKITRFSYKNSILGKKYDIHLSRSSNEYIVCIDDFAIPSDDDCLVRDALKTIAAGIITADGEGRILFINAAAKKMTGWGDESIEKQIGDILNVKFENGFNFDNMVSNITQKSAPISYGNNVLLKKKDGRCLNIDLTISPFTSSNNGASIVAFFRDSSKDISREKEITYLSYHDKLTGLYNRAFFEKKMRELDEPAYYPISIIIGDANGLKMTNDVFGHKQGDSLLMSIANILSLACRETDIIARYGGDEFTVLMPNTTIEEAGKVCQNVLSLCNDQSFNTNKISVSLGYAAKTKSTEKINDVLNVAEDFMYRHKLLESKSYRSSVISSLKKMLFEKSFETEEHAMRLTGLCNEAGRLMGLSQSELNDLELFSMLHDIGKIGVNDSVLLKPGKLTENEWVEMRRHCEIGCRIAQSAPELAHIADYILCHHERWDGKGYPQKLKGTQIPLLSRILSVADSYDAMVNDRYYRKALPREAAIAELKRCSGTQFDPDVVKVFLQVLEPEQAVLPETA